MIMKLAFICGNYLPHQLGGSMISTEALATRLSRSCSVDIICGHSQRNNTECTYRIHQLSPFPYLSFHPESTNYEKRYFAAVALENYFNECSRYLAQHSYNIIDAQGPWCKAASIATVRFVYPEYLEVLAKYGHAIPNKDPWSTKLLELERRTYQSSAVRHFIAVSTKAKTELQKHYHISNESITVVNNGVDTKRFTTSTVAKYRKKIRSRLNVADHEILILYCGNNYIRKNLSVFLEVVRCFYGCGVKLAIMARDKQALDIIGKEDRDHIAHFGITKFPEKLLAASDILLFPTLYDTCAKIVLEAMAMGLPVIVSAASGLSNIIVNGKNGIIVSSPTDVTQYKQVIVELIQNKDLRQKIGKQAAAKVISQLSWDLVVKRVFMVYKKALMC